MSKSIFQGALLSEASYADLDPARIDFGDRDDVKTALLNIDGGGFSPIQASDFVKHWRVVHHQPDTLSGFSATLFERLDVTGLGLGEYTLAIRGTLGVIDIAEDIFGIAAQGVARAQAVDLYRYYKRLTTPRGQAVTYTQGELLLLAGLTSGNFSSLTGTSNYLSILALTSNDTGLLPQPLTGTVDVVGHSLGGHLAMLFTRMFPAAVGQVYTYNGAGLGGVAKEILDQAGFQVDVPSTVVSNIVADQGLDLTAGVGYVIGPSERVFIEQSVNPLENHRIGRLVDALAVHDLLGGLAPTLQPGPLFEAVSNQAGQTLEKLVNALGDLLDAGTPIISTDVREDLYRRIHAINEALYINPDVPAPVLKPAYQGLSVVLLTGKSATGLADLAHGDIAYRYALVHGNPFAVTGLDYSAHNASHELDRYEEAA